MNKRIVKTMLLIMIASLFVFAVPVPQAIGITNSDAVVIDIFGRTINDYGVDLVDWDGYIANPYVKLTVKPPPAAASYPVTVTVRAQGTSRFMMDLPSQLSATGATKTLTFANAQAQQSFKLEIHPDRIGGPNQIENYTLAFTVVQNNGTTHNHTIPIRVLDQDTNQETNLPLVFDYRFDTVQPYFSNTAIRAATERAIKDYFYFFSFPGPFDTVPAGAETNIVPNDNFNGNTNVTNNAAYNGEWIFLRGLNDPYSTGWSSRNPNYHTRNGVTVPGNIHRSLGAALDFLPNKTPFTSLNDEEWYLSDNSGTLTDVYGLIMHEFGHGFAYSDSWTGMNSYKASGGTDPDVVSYQGIPVPLDSSYHITGGAQYADRLSGQTGGWGGQFPNRRWMQTKLSLLVAENAGWVLNRNLSSFLAPQIVTNTLPSGTKGQAYTQTLSAKGGVPFYDWTVVSGSLPAGLSLNRFTGTISGTISSQAQNNYTFTVQLRDYDEMSSPVTKSFTINTGGMQQGDIVVDYLFNQSSGSTITDSSGNGNNAALSGGYSWIAGQSGNALNFGGSDGYASLPSGIVSNLNDFTIAAWVRVNTLSDWARIFDFGTGTGNYMFLAPKAGGSAGLRFAITTGGSGGEQQINAPALPAGVWKHVAVTLSGNTGRLYMDGSQVGINSNMTLRPSNLGNTNQNRLGRSQYADPYLNGALDNFRIYNRALSASEIGSLAGGSTLDDIAPQATASTSFVSAWESLAGLNDGYTPTSSNDRNHPVYGNWNNPGTTQWVEYTWLSNRTISSTQVYWFDDDQGIDLPASYTIQYWNGSSYANVANPSGFGLAANQYNTTTFTPVTTTRLRLNITAKATTSTGIESWKVIGN